MIMRASGGSAYLCKVMQRLVIKEFAENIQPIKTKNGYLTRSMCILTLCINKQMSKSSHEDSKHIVPNIASNVVNLTKQF